MCTEGIELFDARFFRISPAEAKGCDPLQRRARAWKGGGGTGCVWVRLGGRLWDVFITGRLGRVVWPGGRPGGHPGGRPGGRTNGLANERVAARPGGRAAGRSDGRPGGRAASQKLEKWNHKLAHLAR